VAGSTLRKRESAFGHGTRKCASAARGAPVDGRRLGPLDPALLDEGAGKGGPGPRRLRATGPTGTTGDVRGRLRSAIGEDNAPMGRPARKGGPTPRSPRGDAGGKTVPRATEAGPTPSSVRPNRGRIAARWSGATRDNRAIDAGLRLRIDRVGVCGVGAARAACSVIERFRVLVSEVDCRSRGEAPFSSSNQASREANQGSAG
jgi:hypothetical protein